MKTNQDKVRKLVESWDIPPRQAAKEIGIPHIYFCRWLNGLINLESDNIEKVEKWYEDKKTQANIQIRKFLKMFCLKQNAIAADNNISSVHFNYVIKGKKDFGPPNVKIVSKWIEGKIKELLNEL